MTADRSRLRPATWVALALAAAYTVLAVVIGVAQLTQLEDGDQMGTPQVPDWLLALSGIWLLTLIGTLVAVAVLNRQIRTLTGAPIRHWSTRVFVATIFVTLLLQGTLGLNQHDTTILVTTIRTIGGLAVLTGIARARVKGPIADRTPEPAVNA
ncbi:hypothetical protein GCM10010435_77460 [Winogradskya consettensis]|uniref:Uncharacterized protein n=1 Tax=Winogradskya consettensis TaxID=113560 RepID=A0A919VSD5_9ACTN|nr:hypothetical protein [Actinoplanes consettensis]GIM74711.1 hypothetical protein Aco04nite_41670 [Actinoplanes consettensis]